MKFILRCVTSDLSDNLTEMRIVKNSITKGRNAALTTFLIHQLDHDFLTKCPLSTVIKALDKIQRSWVMKQERRCWFVVKFIHYAFLNSFSVSVEMRG